MHSYELEFTPGLQEKGSKGKALLWAVLASCWSLLIIVPTSFGLVAIFVVYGKEEILVSPTDQHPVRPISRTMCRYMDIQTPVAVNMVLMNYPPLLETTETRNVTSPTLAVSLAGNETSRTWAFYLLEGSKIEYELLKSVLNVTFLIIRGQDNFEEWKDSNGECTTCVVNEYPLNCSVRSVEFYAYETDMYYFLLKPLPSCTQQILQYVIHMERRIFHLLSDQMCLNTQNCTFNMFPKSYQEIYVDYEDAEASFVPIVISVTCHPREWIYFSCCFFIPVLLGFIITIVAKYLHKTYERHVTEKIFRKEREEHECPELYYVRRDSSPRRRYVPELSDIEEVHSVGSFDSNTSLIVSSAMRDVASGALNSTEGERIMHSTTELKGEQGKIQRLYGKHVIV